MKKNIFIFLILFLSTCAFCQVNIKDSTSSVRSNYLDEKISPKLDVQPEFPGGMDSLVQFLGRNLQYPKTASEIGIEGRVVLRFVVSRKGEITNVEVIRSLDPACDAEAIRVVKLMPKFTPGQLNGRVVPVYFMLPIIFKLQK